MEQDRSTSCILAASLAAPLAAAGSVFLSIALASAAPGQDIAAQRPATPAASGVRSVLGKPSPDWQAQNLAGEARKLSDFAGKVVVLDFWYRGCGWCVRAMPQMNALFRHYRGKPVAILGVNKDANVEDANFTVKAVGLEYENLHAVGMPELYNVQGYPTLVVLDRRGVVHDIHVGYSPHLEEDLIKVIDGLLVR